MFKASFVFLLVACPLANQVRADITLEQTYTVQMPQLKQTFTNYITVSYAGGRSASSVDKRFVTIFDLAHETITEIDFARTAYSVTSLADLQTSASKAKPNISLERTDQTREIAGFKATLSILTFSSGDLSSKTELWIAAPAKEFEELFELRRRLCATASAPIVGQDCDAPDQSIGLPVLSITTVWQKKKPISVTTLQLTQHSFDPIDWSKFEVPAGFKLVPSKTYGSKKLLDAHH